MAELAFDSINLNVRQSFKDACLSITKTFHLEEGSWCFKSLGWWCCNPGRWTEDHKLISPSSFPGPLLLLSTITTDQSFFWLVFLQSAGLLSSTLLSFSVVSSGLMTDDSPLLAYPAGPATTTFCYAPPWVAAALVDISRNLGRGKR